MLTEQTVKRLTVGREVQEETLGSGIQSQTESYTEVTGMNRGRVAGENASPVKCCFM